MTNVGNDDFEVAIIGMAGKFPKADNLEQFWINLKEELCAVDSFDLYGTDVPEELLNDPNYVKRGVELENKELFDAEYFGFSPKEATLLDPQLRILLECTYSAFASAGYNPKAIEDHTAAFIAADLSSYLYHNLLNYPNYLKQFNQTQLIYANSSIATQIAYQFNLKGPCFDLNTGCSSSLIAVHQACRSLATYEIDLAIAGGASIFGSKVQGYLYTPSGILSRDGFCRAFDESSTGTVMGQGAGLILLKRYSDAIADQDNILAIVRSTYANNDGNDKVGYTAPSVNGQIDTLSQAWSIADINLEDLGYIECHGTGTNIGDPIEYSAIYSALKSSSANCYIGSVKTNIGHLNSAAGIAGLIKTILAMRAKKIPASLFFEKLNKKINQSYDNSKIIVNNTLRDWQKRSNTRIAGVSSFGIGGTNVHVVLEQGINAQKIELCPCLPFNQKRYWFSDLVNQDKVHGVSTTANNENKITKKIIEIFNQLLGVDNLNENNCFFELGGHSLLATQLEAKIYEAFGTKLGIEQLYQGSTVIEISKYIERQVKKENITLQYPVSKAQLQILNHYKIYGPDDTYDINCSLDINQHLSLETLAESFATLIARQASLRTIFAQKNNKDYQIVKPSVNFTLSDKYELDKFFDLSIAPLMRASLTNHNDNTSTIKLVIHHIICDGWSIDLLFKELFTIYNGKFKKRSFKLPSIEQNYIDYCKWIDHHQDDFELNKQEKYWKHKLKNPPAAVHFPYDKVKTKNSNKPYAGSAVSFFISENIAKKVKHYCKQNKISHYVFFVGVFSILLYQHTKKQDIIIGTPVANRRNTKVDFLIGHFVNMLALRLEINPCKSFEDYIAHVKQSSIELLGNQDHSINYKSNKPIFSTEFVFQKSHENRVEIGDLIVAVNPNETKTSKFDLTLSLRESSTKIMGSIEYKTDRYTDQYISMLCDQYQTLIQSALQGSKSEINTLRFFSINGLRSIYNKLNYNSNKLNLKIPAHQMIKLQALKRPNNIAAIHQEDSIIYKDLWQKSQQLGHFLKEKGARSSRFVVLYLERSIDYLISILATLSTGAAFVPLNPQSSWKKNLEIINKIKPVVILCSHDLDLPRNTKLSFYKMSSIHYSNYPACNLSNRVDMQDLAYVMFTSGSTGKPKGVMVEHAGMLNHMLAKNLDLSITNDDCIAQIAIQTFDVSIWQFLCPLLVGGRTAIITGEESWEPEGLISKSNEHRVTILESVPSHTEVILKHIEKHELYNAFRYLRWYVSNAEPMPHSQCKRWFQFNKNSGICNTFGTTESSDDSSHMLISEYKEFPTNHTPTKGVIPNMEHFIVDGNNNLLPPMITGELCVAGVGVSRGYFEDPVKTSKKFLDNFIDQRKIKIYKTGDLARIFMNGTLEIIGRIDDQVKIRGNRVELGEIDNVIIQHPAIDFSLSVAATHQGKVFISSYVLSKTNPAPSILQIKNFLQEKLPDYMIPQHIIFIDELPVLENGKLDRKKLPDPLKYEFKKQTDYVAPTNQMQEEIAKIYAKFLNLNQVGITENFFEIGGNSLLAIDLAEEISKMLKCKVTVTDIFDNPSIQQLLIKKQKVSHEII